MRYDAFKQRLVDAVLNARGETPTALRQAVMRRNDGIPQALKKYVDKVAEHAYKVTDEDVAALQRGESGYADDAVFEITVAAAVGAALHRLDRGMAALRGKAS